eukprot:scaffold358228_cov42-Prasinocladus_malaysianus.AAC.1
MAAFHGLCLAHLAVLDGGALQDNAAIADDGVSDVAGVANDDVVHHNAVHYLAVVADAVA